MWFGMVEKIYDMLDMPVNLAVYFWHCFLPLVA
jgi:hypothetical protein